MQRVMIGFVYEIMSCTGFEGLTLKLITACTLALLLGSSTIGIGWLINNLEKLQMTFLSKLFSPKAADIICNYVTFPGTMLHELSHAIAAWMTGAKVVNCSLFEINSSGRLGHVEFVPKGNPFKKSWQLAVTSCAPVINGIIWMLVGSKLLTAYNLPFFINIILVYLLISILDHMSMSKEDIKNYLKGWFVILPLMVFIMYIGVHLYVAKMRVTG